jgi:hypothetical protein
MENKNWINIGLFIIFKLGLIITIFLVLKDIDHPAAGKFVIGFVVYLLLYVVYLIILVLINMRKLTWSDLRMRFLKFLGWFLFLMAASCVVNHFFLPAKKESWEVGSAIGLSLAIAFSDLMFFRGKQK